MTEEDSILPDGAAAADVQAYLGVIADTHMPERCPALPRSLATIFHGVDLIVHVGDVGELWVLDQLREIAPVVAVAGNDEPAATAGALPHDQIIDCANQRIVLRHGHFVDPAQERAWRSRTPVRGDWVGLCAEFGHAADAGIVIYGHTHVPMVWRHEGVLLINPGAIAAPNPVSRQRLRTVALLSLSGQGAALVRHVDVDDPARTFAPDWWTTHDWRDGARPLMTRFVDSIVEGTFREESVQIWARLQGADSALRTTYQMALLHEAQRCWAGEIPCVTRSGLIQQLRPADARTTPARDQLIAWLHAHNGVPGDGVGAPSGV